MKVERLRAKNILSYDQLDIPFRDFNVFVGPNNSGKSNLFRCIEVIQDIIKGKQFQYPELLQHNVDEPSFSVDLSVALDQTELALLERFLRLCIREVESATQNQNLNWPKVATPEQIKQIRQAFLGPFTEEFVPRIIGAMSHGVIRFEYFGFPGQHPLIRYLLPTMLGEETGIALNNEAIGPRRPVLNDTLLRHFTNRLSELANQTSLEEAVRQSQNADEFLRFSLGKGYSISSLMLQWNEIMNTGNASLLAKATQLSKEIGLEFPVGGQLYLGQFLFKLIQNSLVIAEEFRARPDLTLGLDESVPVEGSFESERLALVLFRLMTRDDASKAKYEKLGDAFAQTFNKRFQFDVSSNEVTIDREKKTRIGVSVKNVGLGRSFPIQFTGAGLAEALYILTLVIGLQRKVILLDEPASHLHPTTQRRLLDELIRVNRDNQVAVITHSPFMIPSSRLSDVARFYLEDGSTRYTTLVEKEEDLPRIMKMVERSPRLLSAIFSDKVILFEGEYEQAALLTWFPKCNPPLVLYDTNVEYVTVGGHSSFLSYYNLLKSWHIPSFSIGDNKAQDATKLIPQRFLFKEDDFSEMLETECRTAFEQALKAFPARQGGKNTQIARYVAENTEPPPQVVELCKSVRQFIGS